MQAHRLGYRLAEPARQPFPSAQLMAIVDAARRRIVAEIVDQVADIVQQCGGDERRVGSLKFGERGALQRVLELSDALAAIIVAAVAVEALEDYVDPVHQNLPR